MGDVAVLEGSAVHQGGGELVAPGLADHIAVGVPAVGGKVVNCGKIWLVGNPDQPGQCKAQQDGCTDGRGHDGGMAGPDFTARSIDYIGY